MADFGTIQFQEAEALRKRVAELEAAMDEASDTAGKLYQMVGRMHGPECARAMDMLVDLSAQLEAAKDGSGLG